MRQKRSCAVKRVSSIPVDGLFRVVTADLYSDPAQRARTDSFKAGRSGFLLFVHGPIFNMK